MAQPVEPAEPRSPSRRRTRWTRALRDPAFPAALGACALLLFSWPFVRAPALSLAEAWGHLFAAWALAIGALFGLSRALRSRSDEPDDG